MPCAAQPQSGVMLHPTATPGLCSTTLEWPGKIRSQCGTHFGQSRTSAGMWDQSIDPVWPTDWFCITHPMSLIPLLLTIKIANISFVLYCRLLHLTK